MNADFQDFISHKDSKTQRKKYFFNLGGFVPRWQKLSEVICEDLRPIKIKKVQR